MSGGPTKGANKHQYSQLKFKGTVYKLGDYVLIRETKKTNMVGQLTGIVSQGGDETNPRRPMVEVRWYSVSRAMGRFYKKDDLGELPGVSERERASLGENEVFDTRCMSKVYADLLNGKCRVWTLREYDGKPGLGADDYYTRATYDLEKVVPVGREFAR